MAASSLAAAEQMATAGSLASAVLKAIPAAEVLAIAPCVAGAGVIVAVVIAARLCAREKLPGRLSKRGEFESEDPANSGAISERYRDFSRIVATKRDAWVFTARSLVTGVPLPVDGVGGDAADASRTNRVCHSQLKFWFQQELGRIEGAVDLGMTSQWEVVDRAIYMLSATPGFDFVMRFQVQPMLLQAKYMLMVSASGQVRVAWYAFACNRVVPGATSGPVVIKLVTEDLRADRAGRTHTELRYTAKTTKDIDMETYIGRQLPLIRAAILEDRWGPFLKA